LFFNVTYLGPDTDPPVSSGIVEDPTNGTAYSLTQLYQFNITWTDASPLDTVTITFNNTNYSTTDSRVFNSANLYSFNITGLAATKYNYTWHANDTEGNSNLTRLAQQYTVIRSSDGANLTLDGNSSNVSVSAGSTVNVTATRIVGESNMQLLKDGVVLGVEGDATSSITNSSIFAAGGPYNITSFVPASENFTVNFTTYYVNILAAEETPNNPPIVNDSAISATTTNNLTTDNLTASFNVSDADQNATYNVTDWRLEGVSIALLNLPFDTNSSITTRDFSTNGINGTLEGNLTWNNTDCAVGGCYEFEGSDSYIDLEPDNFFQMEHRTVSLWFKDANPSNAAHLAFAGGQSSPNRYYIRVDASDLYIAVGNSDDFATYTIEKDVWYHIVVTYENNSVSDSGNATVYVNGTFLTSTLANLSGSSGVNIGSYGDGQNTFWNGSIDEVIIFNRTLSPEQILAIYDAGINNHSIDTLVSQETTVGDNWTVSVSSSDFENLSDIHVISNSIEILAAVAAPNSPPVVNDSAISATTTNNLTTDNLTASFNVSDADEDATYNVTDWRLEGISIALLNLPFDTNSSITTRDFSTNGINGTLVGNLTWNNTDCAVGQ